jgi:hypothetical protein
MTRTRRAEDFANRDFTMMELRIPAKVFNLLEELAKYRGQNIENMSLNMLIDELDGELKNDDEMGSTLEKYLREKYQFRRQEDQ